MKVEITQQIGDIEKVADIASLCYGRGEAKNPLGLFKFLVREDHTSVLEHTVYTFKIEGISRSLLAQLTRHRIASYTVQSQRYIGYEEGISYVVPQEIKNDKDLYEGYVEHMENTSQLYNKMRDKGILKEDARYVFPNAVTCDLYMTINLRSLMNFFALRRAKDSQWEIRDLANKMYDLVTETLGEEL